MDKQIAGASRFRYEGDGPGEQSLDGCSVEFYRRLVAGEEPDIVAGVCPPPASLLELGCGAGRLTRPLAEAGYSVTPVDNAEGMLAVIPEYDPVLADIESLQLGRLFDIVLLASYLVNTPDPLIRQQFLSAAARHLGADGKLLAQVNTRNILDVKAGDQWDRGQHRTTIVSSETDGSLARITMKYEIADQAWLHSFETVYLAEDQISQSLQLAGLEFRGWADSARTWLIAQLPRES